MHETTSTQTRARAVWAYSCNWWTNGGQVEEQPSAAKQHRLDTEVDAPDARVPDLALYQRVLTTQDTESKGMRQWQPHCSQSNVSHNLCNET